MGLQIHDLVNSFAGALVRLDQREGEPGSRWDGVGSLSEAQVVNEVLKMGQTGAWRELFGNTAEPRVPESGEFDLLIPGEWALEINLVRMPAQSKEKDEGQGLEAGLGIPLYADASNPLGDCLKMTRAKIPERKGVLVFGFIRDAKSMSMLTGVKALEVVADYILSVKLGPRHYARTEKLKDLRYKYAEIFGWEVEGLRSLGQSVANRSAVLSSKIY